MVQEGINFFFRIIKWVFTDFLIRVKILNVSILYIFLAITMIGIIIGGVLNTVNAGVNTVSSVQRNKRLGRLSDARHQRYVADSEARYQRHVAESNVRWEARHQRYVAESNARWEVRRKSFRRS